MSVSSGQRLTNIDPSTVELIAAVTRCAEALSLDLVVVGAFARDVWLLHSHGITPTRKTQDVDFAVCVSDWGEYESLRSALLADEGFVDSAERSHPERLIAPNGLPLDLLPFGGIAQERDNSTVITWPTDGVEMNMAGFQEALDTAAVFAVPVESGWCEFRVLTVPSLVILKLVAWKDRQENPVRRKHVEDVYSILANFAAMFPQKVDTIDDWSEMPDDELETAAFLLGRDIQAIASSGVLASLSQLLEHEVTSYGRCELVRDMQRHCGGAFQKSRSLLGWLRKGLG